MDEEEAHARFEFDPEFAAAGIELAPLVMPVGTHRIYQFSDLPKRSFHGLPGLLADSLPDRYGNSLINVWLARTGRDPAGFNAVDRLCVTGVRGMGALEFEPSMGLESSYSQIAKACGVEMTECRILEENGRQHFMTRRFDRGSDGSKRFVQTFAALAHFDYYESGHHSYEELFRLMRQLEIPTPVVEQQFRRVIFNLVGCNQDDHVKNFAFMMDRAGRWDVSPAYDLCHSEGSAFTKYHQLSINGKTTDFSLSDLDHLARYAGLPRGHEKKVLERVCDAFAGWETLALDLGIPTSLSDHVQRTLRLAWS